MNKTQLTKGLNKLGKIVKNNERDLRNILDDEIYAIFPQAEDVEIDKDEIKFYLGEYTGRVTKKDLVDVVGDVKRIDGAKALIVNVAVNRKDIEIIANAMVYYTTTDGYSESDSVDVKIISIERENHYIEPEEKNDEIINQLKSLSSGLMGTLLREMNYTGETTYEVTDQLYEELILYCKNSDKKFSCWQEVFHEYKNNCEFIPKGYESKTELKKIKVARDDRYGRLDNAIIETLMEQGILRDNFWERDIYNVRFFRKNNRINGKQFITITDLVKEKTLLAYYIKDIYRFNFWQECTLMPIIDNKELDNLLSEVI